MIAASSLASVSIADGKFVIQIPTTATVGRPDADVSAGAWLPSQGSELFEMINEITPSASDFIYTNTLSTCELSLNPTVAPGVSLSYRASSGLGNGLTVRLLVDSVVIASWSHSLTTTDDLYTRTLSEQETAEMASGLVTVQLSST